MGAKRIGVFVCHCGKNIAATIDVKRVVAEMSTYPGVEHAENYLYMCSDPGQEIVRKAIREKKLDGIVMSNCSPALHQKTFRRLAQSQGLNPYHCEIANIREQCSWPHPDWPEVATLKAMNIIKGVVEKVKRNEALYPGRAQITRRTLVIGAGISGIRAALDIANAGYPVVLVETEPAIGGKVRALATTAPSFEPPGCLLSPWIAECAANPLIELMAYSEVEELEGYVGNFKAKIRRKASFTADVPGADWQRISRACPVSVPSEFDRGLGKRKAIHSPGPDPYPPMPVIDRKACLHFRDGSCSACKDAAPKGAVDFDMQDEIVERDLGAVVVASGFDLMPPSELAEIDPDPDVIDALQFERLAAPSGPTGGRILRPSDGSVPRTVVFVQCSGSRDPEHHKPYCSRICCMYTAKQARMFMRAVPGGRAVVSYIDVRTTSKGAEEFYRAATETDGVDYMRGRVSRAFRVGGKIRVLAADTLAGKSISIDADMVVLAMAVVAHPSARQLGRTVNIITDEHGFASEAHIKLGPVETLTAGIYIAGACQMPKDITHSVYSSSGAASKVLSLFSNEELLNDPVVAFVDEEVCSGCGYCVAACAFGAPELDPVTGKARVNASICQGCGACAVACPSEAMGHKNFSTRQFIDLIENALKEY